MTLRHERGYTLVELLVVLALLGIMAVLMAEGMRFGGRVWETASRKTHDMESVSASQAMLRTVLQRIVPRSFDPAFAADPDLFRATASQMSFTALAPTAMEAGGLARFEISVRPEAAGQTLVITWSPLYGPQGRQERILVTKAGSVALHYARRDASGTLEWRETWTDQTGAPDLISIRVSPSGQKGAAWPDLLVRPRISRDPTCIYDPVSFGCRNA